MNKKITLTNGYKFVLFFILSGILIFIDQWTKYLVTLKLKGNTIVLLNDIFELFYYKNEGAAFGILQGQKILFFILTVVVLILIFYSLYKMPFTKKYMYIYIFLVLLFAGAIGNFIDRVRFGYVVDFIYFKPINFPVFNVADSYITISCFLLLFCLIFIYKDKDFDFLTKNGF